MESLTLQFSSRLYDILSTINTVEEDNQKPLFGGESEEDFDFPHECCFCAELFFEDHKFNVHDCHKRKQHRCTFGSCRKSFKKSSELRKHEVIYIKITIFAHFYLESNILEDSSQHQELQMS